MKKIIQKQCAFHKLYSEWKKDKKRYVATWEFGGEMYIKELNRWVMMSYKCPARLSDIYNENPNLLEREWITGKSGSNYYGYRISENVILSLIQDAALCEFYKAIKNGEIDKEFKKQKRGEAYGIQYPHLMPDTSAT